MNKLKLLTIFFVFSFLSSMAIQAQNAHKYEYKIGEDTYQYEVEGYDEYGDYCYGTVTINSKTNEGDGQLYNEDEDYEFYIDAYWYENGTIEGIDDEGIRYDLQIP